MKGGTGFSGRPVWRVPMQEPPRVGWGRVVELSALRSLAAMAGTALLGAAFALTPGAARAQTYVVTNSSDSGPGSLRAEITAANATGGTVTFAPSLDGMTIVAGSAGNGPLPAINNNVTVDGSGDGATGITISGGSANRVFFVQSGTVTIENLAIASGSATGGAGGNGGAGGGGGMGAGGAIFVYTGAGVTVANVSFTGNSATGGNGGSSSGSDQTSGGGGGGLGGAGGGGGANTNASAGGGGSGGGGGYSGGGGGGGASSTAAPGAGGAGPGGAGGSGGAAPNAPGSAGSPGVNGGSGGSGGMSHPFGGGGGGGGLGGGNGGDSQNSTAGGGGGGGGLTANSGGAGASVSSAAGNATALGGGGGGGSEYIGPGGNGADLGGGGGAGSDNTIPHQGGSGGLGGGGGGAAGLCCGNPVTTAGGSGGLGGGGGGAFNSGGGTTTAGAGGAGGGQGSASTTDPSAAGGGGGAAFGGAVFVAAGATLTIGSGNSSFSGSGVTAGSGQSGGTNGAATGSDLFLTSGTTTTFSPGSGNTLTLNGTVADDSAASLPAGQSYTAGTGAGAAVAITSGTVVFNGANTYSGSTTIGGGTLQVNGSIIPSTTTVTSGTLSGIGTVGVTNVTGGTLAPGNPGTPTGTLNVNTSLTFQTAATYMITISGTNNSSTAVAGTATPAGAGVTIAAGSSVVVNHTYVILTSTGLIGAFNPSVAYGAYRGTVSDASNNVDLTFAYNPIAPSLPPGTPQNEAAVANAIDNYIASGATLPPGFLALYNLSPSALQQALGELDGEDSTGAATSTFQLINDLFNLISDMALGTGGGGGGRNGGATGFAEPDEALPSDVALAYRKALKQNSSTQAAPQNFDQRWTAWGAGFGGAANYNGNAVVGSNNLSASDFGFAGGMDYHAAPDLKLGFALAGGGTHWSLAQNLGAGRSDVFEIAGYGIKHYGPLYFTAMAAFGNSWFTTDRIAASGDQLRATFSGQDYALRGEAGYRFAVLPTAGLTPYAAVQSQWFHTPTYSENDLTGGGFGLTYAAQNANDTRTELGVRVDDLTSFNAMPLILRERLAWAHDSLSGAALTPTFQALPGASFTVNGAAVPKSSALTSAGAQLFLTANWSLEAKFDGEFASSAQTYAGTGILRYSW